MLERRLLRATLAAMLLVIASCSGTAAFAGRQRAAARTPHVGQWNNDWARGAVFYEIFVRSYYDSNGDGIGDFPGLITKLDYLQTLGIDAIWLMPVFEAASYHGYDATNYEQIEHDYGTNADFQRFLDEAHKRNIRVIVDYVMNHTSDQHPWFIDAASSPTSSKRDWYVWSPTNPGWPPPWGGTAPTWHLKNGAYYYGVFWSGMPDLNYRNTAVKAEMFRIAREWLNAGVDGFRLDATRYLIEDGPGAGEADTPETHQLLKDFADDVRATKPDAFLVGENTVDPKTLATYFADLPSNFDFPVADAIVKSVQTNNATAIRAALADMIASYPKGVIDAPFITNHDQIRIATIVHSDVNKLRDAAAILLTLPGAPFIYYGEEIGLQNGPGSADEQKRTPMPWSATGDFTIAAPWFSFAPGLNAQNVASEIDDPHSLLSYYRNWIATRHQSRALMKGDIALVDAPSGVLAFTRDSGDDRALAIHNLGASSASISFAATSLTRVYADDGVSDPSTSSGQWTVVMPPHTSAVFRVR